MRKPINGLTARRRAAAAIAIVCAVFFALSIRLFYIQIIDGADLQKKASEQWYRSLPLEAPRGKILDRNGVALATSEDVYTVYVRPNTVTDKAGVAAALSEILNLDESKLALKLQNNVSEVTVKRNVDTATAMRVRDLNYGGVYLSLASQRIYPYNSMLSRVIGFTDSYNSGQSGLESYYNNYLKGVNGFSYLNTDIRGNETKDSTTKYLPSVPGMDMCLSIDYNIQSFADEATASACLEFSAKSASMIVMDCNTGGILAMSTSPTYDLNEPPRDDIETLNALTKNILITDVYEPGSTFKILTTAAALETGVVTDSDRFFCAGSRSVDGQRIKCWKSQGHGSQTLAEGVQNSCNCVFMDLAQRMGVSAFYDELELFGIGSKTGIDFNGESAGILMNESSVKTVDLARIGFGQAVAVTPVQLITAVSAIVNGGLLYAPHFATGMNSSEGVSVVKRDSTPLKRIVSEKTSQTMREYLLGVVENGGGAKAKVDGYKIGGKTGTAQKYENGRIAQGKYYSSFIGFAPYDNPEYVVLMIVNEPQGYMYYGSLVAAPYAGQVFAKIFDYAGTPKTTDESVEYVTVPNTVGMSFDEAKTLLDSVGLYFETVGESATVTAQQPVFGERVAKGDVMLLRFGEEA